MSGKIAANGRTNPEKLAYEIAGKLHKEHDESHIKNRFFPDLTRPLFAWAFFSYKNEIQNGVEACTRAHSVRISIFAKYHI